MENFRIELPKIFSFQSTLHSHGWIDLPPFFFDPATGVLQYYYLDMTEREIAINIKYNGNHFLEIQSTADDLVFVKKIITRIFRLDADVSKLYRLAAKKPQHRWIITKAAGRLLCSGSLWEDMVKMICTTNCSWTMTRIMVTNLIKEISSGNAFPSPEMVSSCDEPYLREKVRLGYRSRYILELARDICTDRIDLNEIENWKNGENTLYRRLLQIKGIGPYAAGSLLKLLGHYRHPAPDSWSRKRFMQLYDLKNQPSDNDIINFYKRYGSWGGLIFWLEMTEEWYLKLPG